MCLRYKLCNRFQGAFNSERRSTWETSGGIEKLWATISGCLDVQGAVRLKDSLGIYHLPVCHCCRNCAALAASYVTVQVGIHNSSYAEEAVKYGQISLAVAGKQIGNVIRKCLMGLERFRSDIGVEQESAWHLIDLYEMDPDADGNLMTVDEISQLESERGAAFVLGLRLSEFKHLLHSCDGLREEIQRFSGADYESLRQRAEHLLKEDMCCRTWCDWTAFRLGLGAVKSVFLNGGGGRKMTLEYSLGRVHLFLGALSIVPAIVLGAVQEQWISGYNLEFCSSLVGGTLLLGLILMLCSTIGPRSILTTYFCSIVVIAVASQSLAVPPSSTTLAYWISAVLTFRDLVLWELRGKRADTCIYPVAIIVVPTALMTIALMTSVLVTDFWIFESSISKSSIFHCVLMACLMIVTLSTLFDLKIREGNFRTFEYYNSMKFMVRGPPILNKTHAATWRIKRSFSLLTLAACMETYLVLAKDSSSLHCVLFLSYVGVVFLIFLTVDALRSRLCHRVDEVTLELPGEAMIYDFPVLSLLERWAVRVLMFFLLAALCFESFRARESFAKERLFFADLRHESWLPSKEVHPVYFEQFRNISNLNYSLDAGSAWTSGFYVGRGVAFSVEYEEKTPLYWPKRSRYGRKTRWMSLFLSSFHVAVSSATVLVASWSFEAVRGTLFNVALRIKGGIRRTRSDNICLFSTELSTLSNSELEQALQKFGAHYGRLHVSGDYYWEYVASLLGSYCNKTNDMDVAIMHCVASNPNAYARVNPGPLISSKLLFLEFWKELKSIERIYHFDHVSRDVLNISDKMLVHNTSLRSAMLSTQRRRLIVAFNMDFDEEKEPRVFLLGPSL